MRQDLWRPDQVSLTILTADWLIQVHVWSVEAIITCLVCSELDCGSWGSGWACVKIYFQVWSSVQSITFTAFTLITVLCVVCWRITFSALDINSILKRQLVSWYSDRWAWWAELNSLSPEVYSSSSSHQSPIWLFFSLSLLPGSCL